MFSHSVVFKSLQPHGLQHTRLPCPSPSPGVCSDSCPLSQWCYPAILFSIVHFSCLLSFPASGSLRLLRVPWTARRSNQSILKEINPAIHWRTDAEASILCSPDEKRQLIVKDPDAGEKDWGQEKGVIALALPAVVVTDHIKMYLC